MTDAERGRQSILNPTVLRRLFRQLEATDVDELEVVWGTSRLYLRREPGARTFIEAVGVPGEGATVAGAPVVAPLTGIFWGRPSPEQPPFVAVGEMVVPGQVVGLIETMKLFNEVIADRAGEVLSIVATDGDLVEVGQALMYVGPREVGEPA